MVQNEMFMIYYFDLLREMYTCDVMSRGEGKWLGAVFLGQ
jgi:hypothetical protein